MASLLDTLTQGLGSTDSLKDYQHASKIFVDGKFLRTPKYAFMFYVIFDYADSEQGLRTPAKQGLQIGALCKSAQLPKYTIDNQVLNAYNRPNIVQKKLKYDPVTLRFHDDSSDIIRDFWYDYMSFFYRDGDYSPELYQMQHKYGDRPKDAWGYNLRPEFDNYTSEESTNYRPLRAIRIYSFTQGKFSEYVLINPVITAFRHGEHNMEGSNLLEHEMTVTYETVKYYKGKVMKDTFADSLLLLYDNVSSPLSSGVTSSIFGQGGLVGTFDSVINDLAAGNFQGAFLRLNKAKQTFSGKSIGDMLKTEGLTAIQSAIRTTAPTLTGTIAALSAADSLFSGGKSGVTVATNSGIPTYGQTGVLTGNNNNPTLTNDDIRILDWFAQELKRDETAAQNEYRVSSNSELIGTVAPPPETTIAGFPKLPTTTTAEQTTTRTLSQFSVQELTEEIAARYGINLNEAETLVVNATQGQVRPT